MTTPTTARQYSPIGNARGAAEVAAAVARLKRDVASAVPGEGSQILNKAAAFTAEANKTYALTGFTGTITLPTSFADGKEVQLIYQGGTGTITVAGGTFSETMTTIGDTFTLVWHAGDWQAAQDTRSISEDTITTTSPLTILDDGSGSSAAVAFVDTGNLVRWDEAAQRFEFIVAGAERLGVSATSVQPGASVIPSGDALRSSASATLRWNGVHSNLYSLRTPAGFVGEEAENTTGHVATTDASNNDVTLIGLSTAQHVAQIRVMTIATRDAGANLFVRVRDFAAQNVGGTVSLFTTSVDSATAGTGVTCAAAPVVSGTNVLLRHNGNAAENWEWTNYITIQEGGFTS